VAVEYDWRGSFANAELNALHAEAFGHRVLEDDRNSQVHRYSLGWVCARRGGGLVGFVNVAWDGGVLAFILDTVVALDARREGIGKARSLLRLRAHARPAAASGSTSTSRRSCDRSISTPAGSCRRMQV
jgi:hypothetical protein